LAGVSAGSGGAEESIQLKTHRGGTEKIGKSSHRDIGKQKGKSSPQRRGERQGLFFGIIKFQSLKTLARFFFKKR
jgi:hypothetical protein